MAIGDISLSASARQNLLSLQGTSKLLGQTQARLASGKKINSALDGASSFFASQGFLNSANDLSSLKDSMSTALQTIKAASDTIEALSTVVEQLKGIVNSALQTTDVATRTTLATQYNDLLNQFDLLVQDGTFNGTNLVNSINSSLKVSFSTTDATDNLTVQGKNLTASGLGMGDALANFSSTTLVNTVTHSLTVASTNQTLTSQVYSGTLSGLTVTGAGSSGANSGVGAVIASNATVYDGSEGATVASTAAGTVTALNTALGSAAVATAGATNAAGVTRVVTQNVGGGSALGLTITGQFTATGGAGSTFTSATGILTAGTANTITLGAGQTLQAVYDDGSDLFTATYTNNSANAVTFTLSNAADTVSTFDGGAHAVANVTATYKLTAGTVDTTGLSIPTSASATLGGNSIVDSQDGAVGATLSYIDSALSSLTAAGTTTSTGGTAYDVTGATITGVANTDVTATLVGGAAASTVTYAATNAHVSLTGASILNDDKTIVTADALTSAQNQLTDALKTLRAAASALGNNNTIVSTRQDFTTNLITTLQTASDNLVLADTNEEGANLQALQASSSLGIIALGISGQQAQAILRLF